MSSHRAVAKGARGMDQEPRRREIGDLRIRPATGEDRPFIVSLSWRLDDGGLPPWHDRAKFHAFHQAGVDQSAAVTEAIAEGSLTDRAVLIAEAVSDDEPPIPLGIIDIRDDRSFLTQEAQAYIEVLAITKAAEGRGVGWALMQAAETWARVRGHRLVVLDTAGVNTHARAFYRRCGFEEEVVKYAKVI